MSQYAPSIQQGPVLVLGAWHLGSVFGACLAQAGSQVYLWDHRANIRDKWATGTPPLFEPGLTELTDSLWNKNLFWADSLNEVSLKSEWIILAYDTPINEKDEVQLQEVEMAFQLLIENPISPTTRFLFTSQLPVGTSRRFRNLLKTKYPEWRGYILYQPENLRLGSAIESLRRPDRVALGFDTLDEKMRLSLESEFRLLFHFPEVPIDRMGLESAEMVKHALNAYLATCVVFGNELSVACEIAGADAWEVAASLKKDSRVGKKAPLFPGLGFAGGTLARDVKTLSQKIARPNFFTELYTRNDLRNEWVQTTLRDHLGTLDGKTILLLGVTYKPDTSTVRRSPAVDIGLRLRADGARVIAADPKADLGELSAAEREQLPFSLESDANQASLRADAIVLVTEWPDFLNLDWNSLAQRNSAPLIIDTKNFLLPLNEYPNLKRIIPGKSQNLLHGGIK